MSTFDRVCEGQLGSWPPEEKHLNGSPYHCASCLFLLQTALLVKPLLPHHGPLPFDNTLTVKSLTLLVCVNSHEHSSTLTGMVFLSINGIESESLDVPLLPSSQVSNGACCCKAIVISRQIIHQIPHLGLSRLAYL